MAAFYIPLLIWHVLNIEKKEWKAKKIIYVVDSRQANHFNQVFNLAKKIGIKSKLSHAQFGIMSLEEGKISTRGGQSINLKDLLDKGYEEALKIVEEKKSNTKR